jgi:hypothetical protein
MADNNITIKQIRQTQYDYHNKLFPYINDWKKNPYTWLKARFYMEASSLLVYFLLKTKIKPNTVTIIYALLGLFGGVLLAIAKNETVLAAIFIFFCKGILDWSDGLFARTTGQTSITGHILDTYGATLGSLGLQIGLGFYVAQKSEIMLFYYMVPLIPLFYAIRLHSYASCVLFGEYITSEKIKEYNKKNLTEMPANPDKKPDAGFDRRYGKMRNFLKYFLDDRARTVDFICLLLILEMLTSIFITWIIFLGFLVKQFLIFLASFFMTANKGEAERQLRNKIEEINKVFVLDK